MKVSTSLTIEVDRVHSDCVAVASAPAGMARQIAVLIAGGRSVIESVPADPSTSRYRVQRNSHILPTPAAQAMQDVESVAAVCSVEERAMRTLLQSRRQRADGRASEVTWPKYDIVPR
ncbi:hypothetical protein THAOC_15452 [Thalassiosira oceanica]|uniref:Uncharacterized protein n=1 Tax=Thalassiosira oceanica TaxID=159749 RepID=K0SFS7_THAOC|nr:hypothetical protein THAOC_15452 [Thalassiosira oceanica]|eukprot:EJK63869.1 hypothetical protein THAOC_15452 [Thalassiosira oceanica]